MQRTNWRAIRPIIVVLTLVLVMPPSLVAGAGPTSPAPRDVTNTREGRDFAARASERVARKYGIEMSADSMTVWKFGDRMIAGPKGTRLTMTEQLGNNGMVNHRFTATEAASGSVPGEPVHLSEITPQVTGSWTLVGSYCWIDQRSGQISWMDVCYAKYKLSSDGDTGSDYFALNMYSTFAAPTFGFEIGDPWIQSNPAAGVTHNWTDWDPAADTELPCTTQVHLTVVAKGVGLTVTGQQCAVWDITKYATAGKFRNKWTEGFCMMRQGETSLEFEIVSRVAQGKVPGWTFNWLESYQPAACSF
jgi:hypothetical protein